MLIYYGSFAYFIYIFLALGFCALMYFLFRKKSDFAKRALVLSLSSINLLQHLFKSLIYPQYRGDGFSYLGSAYNMCAFLIIISPFVMLSGSSLMRDFITFIGTVAGAIAIIVPFWFIGQSAFQWEAYRFYICHTLLFSSSLLPSILGLHKLKFKNFAKIGFVFLLALAVILVNDIVFISLGLYPGRDINNLFGSLSDLNPCWCMHPPAIFRWLSDIICALSPKIFLSSGQKPYTPILWYALPMYVFITVIAFIISAICDKDGFSEFLSKSKSIFIKIKSKFKK